MCRICSSSAGCSAAAEPNSSDEKMRFVRELWRRRLSGVQRNVEVRRQQQQQQGTSGKGPGCHVLVTSI
jgi:hypothetical protein